MIDVSEMYEAENINVNISIDLWGQFKQCSQTLYLDFSSQNPLRSAYQGRFLKDTIINTVFDSLAKIKTLLYLRQPKKTVIQ